MVSSLKPTTIGLVAFRFRSSGLVRWYYVAWQYTHLTVPLDGWRVASKVSRAETVCPWPYTIAMGDIFRIRQMQPSWAIMLRKYGRGKCETDKAASNNVDPVPWTADPCSLGALCEQAGSGVGGIVTARWLFVIERTSGYSAVFVRLEGIYNLRPVTDRIFFICVLLLVTGSVFTHLGGVLIRVLVGGSVNPNVWLNIYPVLSVKINQGCDCLNKVPIHVRVRLASPAGLGFQWVKLVRVWSVTSLNLADYIYI
jgi:hypothetical protein